jgi:hypothetical protein
MSIKVCKRCNEEKECLYGKQYYKECQNLFSREWKAKNKERIAEYNKKYKSERKEEISEYNAKYSLENRKKIQERQNKQHKERRETDLNFKLSGDYRKKLNKILKYKTNKYIDYLGCTKNFFISWLEHNHQNDMNFSNYGEVWCLDHVLPCSYFNLEDKEQIKLCFNWTNLRPLYVKQNLSRQNKVTEQDIQEQDLKVAEFIKHIDTENIYIAEYNKLNYLTKQ